MDERSGIGSILKTLAVIIGILCFIGGIVLGNAFGVSESFSGRQSGFNWSIALTSWLMSAILCSLVYAIGEIVDQLTLIRQTLERLSPGKPLTTNSSSFSPEHASAPRVIQATEPAKPQPVVSAQQAGKESVVLSDVDSKWVYCGACGQRATREFAKIRRNCPNCNTPYEL